MSKFIEITNFLRGFDSSPIVALNNLDIVFMTVYSQQSTMKMGRSLENVFQSDSKSRKEKHRILDKIYFQTKIFSSSYEQSNSKQRLFRNFTFAFPTLFECGNWARENSIDYCCRGSKLLLYSGEWSNV